MRYVIIRKQILFILALLSLFPVSQKDPRCKNKVPWAQKALMWADLISSDFFPTYFHWVWPEQLHSQGWAFPHAASWSVPCNVRCPANPVHCIHTGGNSYLEILWNNCLGLPVLPWPFEDSPGTVLSYPGSLFSHCGWIAAKGGCFRLPWRKRIRWPQLLP